MLLIAVPLTVSLMTERINDLSITLMIGNDDDEDELGGLGVANIIINLFTLSIYTGVNLSIGTHITQCIGAGNLLAAGDYLNRGRLIAGLAIFPVIIIISISAGLMEEIIDDKDDARDARLFLFYMIPYIFMQGQF